MALHKGLLKNGFKLPECEKHFHDHDETWVILKGKGTGYWIDHVGQRVDFVLEEGDIWMIPTGYEHGSEGPNSEDFEICVFNGTTVSDSKQMAHYYVEKEAYIPVMKIKRIPTQRYCQVAPQEEEK